MTDEPKFKLCYGCNEVAGVPNTTNMQGEPVFICKKCDEESEPLLIGMNGCEPCSRGDHDNCTGSQHCHCDVCGEDEEP